MEICILFMQIYFLKFNLKNKNIYDCCMTSWTKRIKNVKPVVENVMKYSSTR